MNERLKFGKSKARKNVYNWVLYARELVADAYYNRCTSSSG